MGLWIGSLSAATTLTVTNASGTGATSSVGSVVADNGSLASGQMSYTISGLTLDGTGSADDSIMLTFSISAAIGSPALSFTSEFGDSGNSSNQINSTESLTFSFASGSVTLGGGGSGGLGVGFDGFSTVDPNQISTTGNEGFQLTVNGNTTAHNSTAPIDLGGLYSSFTVAGITAAQFNTLFSSSSGLDSLFTVADYDFQVTVGSVPEPSRTMLATVALGTVLLHRRRKI
ncbi:MAG: hypothetical protein KDK99_04635 [Verrucomicrobiales bacterium]|nr:hypothetical protein [Verrucomicrobiales bacterium]